MPATGRVVDQDDLFTAIDMWAADFRVALMDKKTYHTRHNQYYLDARILNQQWRNMKVKGTTIFDFTDEVFQDAALRGYIDSIHHDGLCTGYKNWVEGMNPVPIWKPAGELPPLPSLPPPRKTRETYEKGRAVVFLEEMLEEEEEQQVEKQLGKGSMGYDGKGKPPPKATSKNDMVEDLTAGEKATSRPGPGSKPANAKELVSSQRERGHMLKSASAVEEGDDDNMSGPEEKVNDPPCNKCAKNGIPCVAQPEPKRKPSGSGKRGVRERLVCLPCQKGKNKCELAMRKARSPSPDIIEVINLPPNSKAKEVARPKLKLMPRKKPQVVPAGRSGGYAIPEEIKEHLEAHNCRANELEEQLLDLKEKFIRLESGHQSMQVYNNQVLGTVGRVEKLNEDMAKRMNAMFQVAREDRKGHRLIELMEEVYLALGIPFTPTTSLLKQTL